MSTIEKAIIELLSESFNQVVERGLLQDKKVDTTKHAELSPTLDVLDAARHLKISKYTVINRIKEGKLRAYKQGKYWRIKREWLLEYEDSLGKRTTLP